MKLGSLFDGIGGFPYAGYFFGIKPIWASEILPQAVSVTARHFPDMEHLGDLTKLNGAELPPVDIITFGSPCQDLSTAGRRAGMDGERSSLFYEAIRIIDEMREATNGQYPKYAVWENVPGALSSGKPRGSDFRAVIEAFTKTEIPMPDTGGWANAGLARSDGVDIAWRILNAQFHGVPQRRRRIFLVASFGAGCPGEILFIEKGLRGNSSPCRKAREGIAADAEGCVGSTMRGGSSGVNFPCGANSCLTPWDVQSRRIHSDDGQWPTLYGENGGGHGYAAVTQNHESEKINNCAKCLNPWETQQARVFAGDGVSPTLAGADGGGGRNPAGLVIQNPVAAFLKEPSANARSIGYSEKISPTLKSSSPCLCEKREAPSESATVYGLCAKNSNSMLSNNPHSGIYKADTSRTLDQNGGNPGCNQGGMIIVEPAVILNDQGGDNISVEKSDISPTLRSETHGHLPIVANKDFAFGVHQGQGGDVNVSETAYSLTTNSGASSRNAPLVTHQKPAGLTSKGNGDCFLTTECHGALSQGGGQAGQGYPAVLIPYTEVHPKITGTLVASGSGLSRPGGMASEPDLCVAYERPAYALQGNMIGRQDHNGPQGSGVNEDVCFTVTATDVGGVAAVFSKLRSDNLKEVTVACTQTARQYKEATDLVCEIRRSGKCPNLNSVSAVDCRNYKEIGNISGTLQAKDKPGYSLNYQNPVRIPSNLSDEECPCADEFSSETCFSKSGFSDLKEGVGTLCAKGGSYGGGSENLVVSDSTTKYIVRRLTPTECERLQGFPDGWTKIGHDEKEISDTRRYQMLGNSVAIPCVAFVLGGIAYAEAMRDKKYLFSTPGGGVSHAAKTTGVS